MRPGHDLEAEFRAPILLNLKENLIEVKLPVLARELRDLLRFRVACEHPERRQRLHLLIIGVGQEDEDELRDRALQALHGELLPNSKTRFKCPAFDQGEIYGPLLRDVIKPRVWGQLARIKNEINPNRAAADAPIEVVMIYYQGGEWIEGGKTSLRLRTGLGRNGCDVVGIDELTGFFAGSRGAQLILLDVTRSQNPTPILLSSLQSRPSGDAPIGLLRFSWLAQSHPSVPPIDDRLLATLEQAISRSLTLKDVVSQISKKHRELKKLYPDLIFDDEIPEPFSKLVVGGLEPGR